MLNYVIYILLAALIGLGIVYLIFIIMKKQRNKRINISYNGITAQFTYKDFIKVHRMLAVFYENIFISVDGEEVPLTEFIAMRPDETFLHRKKLELIIK